MFLAVLIAMYVASSAILTRGQYGALRQSAEDRRAEEAARSGLEYAQARLEEDPAWCGNGGGVVVDTPTLMVREEGGNVVGIVSTSDGGRGQFRIRFNHQDGPAGTDVMVDPPSDMIVDSPHVSVNNVLNAFSVPLPLGDGPGNACQGSVTGYPVPEFTAAIVCEGRVFEELASAGAQTANLAPDGVEATRVIEAFYRVSDFSGETPAQDAVTMAGRGVDMKLFNGAGSEKVTMSTYQGMGPAQLRSKGDVTVTDVDSNAATVDGVDAHLLLPDPNTLTALLAGGVQRGSEDINGDFYKLTWEQASTVGADAGSVPAGVYVYWASDQKLHYYDMSYSEYMTFMKADPANLSNPGEIVDLPPDQGITFVPSGTAGPDGVTSTKNRFVVTNDLEVQATAAGTDDLTIIPRAGAKEDLEEEDDATMGGGALPTVPTDVASLFPPILPPDPLQLPGLVETAVQIGGDWNQNGNIHQLLSVVAKNGTIAMTQDDVVQWNNGTIPIQNGDKADVVVGFLNGELEVTNVNQPDLNFLEEVSSGVYRMRDGVLHAFLSGQPFNAASSQDFSELELGAAADSEPLTPSDFEMTFAPEDQSGVRVVAPGDVRIAADLKGSGASLSAEGQIRLLGVGFDLDAANGEEGTDVSLYAKDKIVISTLKKNPSADYEFTGLRLRGVLYSWKDIVLKMGHADDPNPDPQNVYIQGTMVAYGGEPGVDAPGTSGGKIDIRADQIDLVFDPGYLVGLDGSGNFRVSLSPLSQSYR